MLTVATHLVYTHCMTPRRSPNGYAGSIVSSPADTDEFEVAPGLFIAHTRWNSQINHRGFMVKFTVRITATGPICESITIEPTREMKDGNVTGEVLRSLPIAAWLTRTIELAFPYVKDGDKRVQVATQQLVDRRTRQPKSKLLPTVVEAYRRAVADPRTSRAPTAAVAKELGYQRGHISRLLSQARAEGLLGPAKPGRSGEWAGRVTKESS